MKFIIPLSFVFVLFFSNCEMGGPSTATSGKDTIPPVLRLAGNEIDTALVYMAYSDPWVILRDVDEYGDLKCIDGFLEHNPHSGVTFNKTDDKLISSEESLIQVEGTVDVRYPGTYTLTYTGRDHAGNLSIPVTRTVKVVENPHSYLNGIYDVKCDCKITDPVSSKIRTSTGTYTAYVSNASKRGFELSLLNIGPDYIMPKTALIGDTLDIGYYHRDLNYNSRGYGSLAPDKKSFTITAVSYPWQPLITYSCTSVYTRRLDILKQEKK